MKESRAGSLLSIAIPCYQQLDLARSCLETIWSQSFQDFTVTLLDDGDSRDYRAYVDALSDPRVRYRRNGSRLGAMRNMFQAIYWGTEKYSLAFHEDDLLGHHYLRTAVDILEAEPRCGFVSCVLKLFDRAPSTAEIEYRTSNPRVEIFDSAGGFLRAILGGTEPMFGSVVYRRQAIDGLAPQIDAMGTLCDRPFLLDILQKWTGAIVIEPMAFCRQHGAGDRRHESLSVEHIFAFFQRYRTVFPSELSSEDGERFQTYASYWLSELQRLIPEERRPSVASFYLRAWREGLYHPWRGGLVPAARRAWRLLAT